MKFSRKGVSCMREGTIFPREEKTEVLFQKILDDPWACEKLQETFCNYLFCDDEINSYLSPLEFSQALFNAYHNRDLSAFLMAICENTIFDLLRNSYLIPYRFNADGIENPVIMTDDNGLLLPKYKSKVHEKDYNHFHEIYKKLNNNKKIYLAKAYRYNHKYTSDNMEMKQQILEKNTGILVIRELPDTITANKTEAEAYSAVWDLMIELEKNLPMAFVFYSQDSLVENNKRYDEIGIFLPNSIFLKHLEKHVAKAEAIIYANK